MSGLFGELALWIKGSYGDLKKAREKFQEIRDGLDVRLMTSCITTPAIKNSDDEEDRLGDVLLGAMNVDGDLVSPKD